MRIPLATSIESRDGSTTKDAKVVNGIIEANDGETRLRKRPGNTDLGSVRSGAAQGAYYFNGQVISIHGNAADRSTTGPLANNSIGTIETGTRTVTGITRVGATATAATTPNPNGIPNVGATLTIAGADQPEYNKTITTDNGATANCSRANVSYTVAGAPATPATGSITMTWNDVVSPNSQRYYFADNGLTTGSTGYLMVKGPYSAKRIRSDWNLSGFFEPLNNLAGTTDGYPALTVAGCEFMDGYFFVMDSQARVFNCNLNADPSQFDDGSGNSAWLSSSFIKCNEEPGGGVCLSKTGNYILALKEFSTEPLYDAANPTPGSPLSIVKTAVTKVGCASAGSVAKVEGMVVWISQSRAKGRSVHAMQGLDQSKISTPAIDKILDADDLATVWAYGLKLGGHTLYLLTLVTSNITLVYDFTSQTWGQWSSMTAGSPVTVSTITVSGTTATVNTATAHNASDGDPVSIAGASDSNFNGVKQITFVSATSYTFDLPTSGLSVPTGSITSTPYTESYFKFTHYVNGGGKDLLLHESDGRLYQINPAVYQDAGNPINVFTRTIRIDGGVIQWKPMARLNVIGDEVADYLMVRWSDDDSQTFSKYRREDLSNPRPNIRKCGAFRRRSIETRFVGNNPLRLEALEPETGGP